MTRSAGGLLLDTNVWLDYYDAARPRHAESLALCSYAKQNDIPLLYAVHCAKDIFFLLNASLKRDILASKGIVSESDALAAREAAWGALEHLRQEAFAASADESDVWLASKYRCLHDDFEDNLLFAAAQRSNAAFLVTNDEQLIKHSPVPTLTPADSLAALKGTM